LVIYKENTAPDEVGGVGKDIGGEWEETSNARKLGSREGEAKGSQKGHLHGRKIKSGLSLQKR